MSLFFLDKRYDIIIYIAMCLLIGTVSQMSDVTDGPLVFII